MKKIFTYLIATAAMMIVSAAAMAQGGLTPFVGSTHTYDITPDPTGVGTNIYLWSISGGGTINGAVNGTSLSVTWSSTGPQTITFTETNPTTLCATVKTVPITVSANAFDVSTTDPTTTCNAADGVINTAGPDTTTSITFTVDMTTSSSFSPDWKFTFTLTSSTGATVANVKVGGSSVTAVTGTYTSPNQSSTSGTGTVDVTMDVTGGINSLEDMILTITSATELTYSTPDKDSDDWGATQTINPLPSTSDITTD